MIVCALLVSLNWLERLNTVSATNLRHLLVRRNRECKRCNCTLCLECWVQNALLRSLIHYFCVRKHATHTFYMLESYKWYDMIAFGFYFEFGSPKFFQLFTFLGNPRRKNFHFSKFFFSKWFPSDVFWDIFKISKLGARWHQWASN